DLNRASMNVVAHQIIGERDFESFCKYDAEVHHYRCTVLQSRWLEQGGHLVYEISANRFLHGMVRGLVGTMIDVGRGFIPIAAFGEIMEARDRRKAGMAAPPQGLFLEEVLY
ncbi:MAG TPA: tRNA pseudouridine(38-40) synthase TruA, partial [Bacteroidota bacterium]|nr:tRNA pseudouridine(38-40) synthase TruA [Bacteroidota bacterium]